MKTTRLVLAALTCASGSVFAQTSAPDCGLTNFDQRQDLFTVVNPASGARNQQCFLTVHAASPDNVRGRFTEGSYDIVVSGGGGGGGGGGAGKDSYSGSGGQGGAGAAPSRTTRHLAPGVYRMTLGTGGLGGGASYSEGNGGNAGDGNPTGMTEAYSGQSIAGYPGAEQWAGRSENYQVAAGRGGYPGPSNAVSDGSGPGAVNGANGGQNRDGASESGFAGGHGYIKLTQLSQPQVVAPAPAPTPAPAIIEQPRQDLRPIKQDRN
jgi:hypothetical protein